MEGKLAMSGNLSTRFIPGRRPAPWSWQRRNRMRWAYISGWLGVTLAKAFSRLTGATVLQGELRMTKIDRHGRRTEYGVVGRHVVTTAFVNFMVDQLQAETSQWGDFKYHDSGVGTTAAVVGDTDIETTDGESRVAGTQVEGASANIYKSVGTISYTSTKAITEHGLFSQATGTTLMDRHVFSSVGVENGDSIEFTYQLTCTAGG